MNTAYISLGANIEPETHLPAAVSRLVSLGEVRTVSHVYETAPVGETAQPNFLNAAVVLLTELTAPTLKSALQAIEQALGRQRSDDPNAQRTIDLDIALFNRDELAIGKRRIPDPDILTQAHVAQPLADLAPAWVHPVTGETLAAIAARLAHTTDLRRRDDVRLAT